MKAGDRKGMFTFVQVIGTKRDATAKRTLWLIRCDCGREYERTSNCVGKGGCLCQIQTHGKSHSKEHMIWCAIKARCFNRNNKNFDLYGGRGISMSSHWTKSFENFYADMGPAPSPTHTVDRINSNGDYEPGNCRWATRMEQANNTRRNILVEHKGSTKTLVMACRDSNVPYASVYRYMRRYNMEPLDAIDLVQSRVADFAGYEEAEE